MLEDEWDFDYPEEPEPEERPRDPKIDEAKAMLMGKLFEVRGQEVFYLRQIELMFEKPFYHWLTSKALEELAAEGKIQTETAALTGEVKIRFYFARGHRYWRRQAESIRSLVAAYSESTITTAVGRHGETMFDAALPTAGFLPVGRNARSYAGREWTRTSHDLDRIFTKDGVGYGTEIKNTLGYIPRVELDLKMDMCKELGLKPLFIMRFAPKSYIWKIKRAGGFALLFKYQLYPFGMESLARDVRDKLGLHVDCPRAIADGTVRRFANWHDRTKGL